MPEPLLRAAATAYWETWSAEREALISRSSGDTSALERTLFAGAAPILAPDEAERVVAMTHAERRAIPPVGLLFNEGSRAVPCRTAIVVAGELVRSSDSIAHHPPGWRALQRVCELRNASRAEDWDGRDVREAARSFSRLFWRLQAQKERRSAIPADLSQQTFIEARQVGIALADGPSLRNWSHGEAENDGALVHRVAGSTLAVRLRPPRDEPHDELRDYEQLEAEVRKTGVSAALAFNLVLGTVIAEGRVRLGLDDLLRQAGITPRSAAERRRRRLDAARWVDLFGRADVIGLRPGYYREHRTRRPIDLTVCEPLLHVTWPEDRAEADAFVVEPSSWTARVRDDRRIVSSFGQLGALAEIPAGKPSGAWARSIGMALHQLWRERATGAVVQYAGEENRQTLRFARPLTRRELFDLFRSDPLIEDVLVGPNPSRAQTYWDGAVAILREKRVIGHYAQTQVPLPRKGWQSAWLTQPLDIRPSSAQVSPLIAIARRAKLVGKHAKPVLVNANPW